ncbi:MULTISPECIES: hypothetical protein [Staphylococcus]|uniref:hypothetical protein n=1 Tax=Staphylococcus TaxID=1279 RepID=UPI000D1B0245|nr:MULTISPECIES: hypothetical protein [Staphylococcus]MDT0656132.1 hypothetical protein [Staphylococcus chromogenes]MDY3276424.1 hypothetical protein [Staphylococcus chromogenes]NHM76280.1 hypothetical protein [Staphylococcus sp. 11511212]PTG18067.1 hypothetical protein BU642_10820 [Staphylococcus chromogenes]PTG95814.1 hypothetical protein BU632_07690 [Staphylococcus chromogenes]
MIQTSNSNDFGWLIDIILPRIKKYQLVDQPFDILKFKKNLENESQNYRSAFIRDMTFGILGHD